MSDSLKKTSDLLIRSFLVSNLSNNKKGIILNSQFFFLIIRPPSRPHFLLLLVLQLLLLLVLVNVSQKYLFYSLDLLLLYDFYGRIRIREKGPDPSVPGSGSGLARGCTTSNFEV